MLLEKHLQQNLCLILRTGNYIPTAQVEEQEVLAITFHPDKAVACFLAQDQPVVLSMGLTSKPLRRARMNRRAWPLSDAEVASVPDTAAGEYED